VGNLMSWGMRKLDALVAYTGVCTLNDAKVQLLSGLAAPAPPGVREDADLHVDALQDHTPLWVPTLVHEIREQKEAKTQASQQREHAAQDRRQRQEERAKQASQETEEKKKRKRLPPKTKPKAAPAPRQPERPVAVHSKPVPASDSESTTSSSGSSSTEGDAIPAARDKKRKVANVPDPGEDVRDESRNTSRDPRPSESQSSRDAGAVSSGRIPREISPPGWTRPRGRSPTADLDRRLKEGAERRPPPDRPRFATAVPRPQQREADRDRRDVEDRRRVGGGERERRPYASSPQPRSRPSSQDSRGAAPSRRYSPPPRR
jgi:hypothetical protein